MRYIAAGFLGALAALVLVILLNPSTAHQGIVGLRAAVTVLAGGLVSVVSHQLGRKYTDVRCPICHGTWPSDGAFKQHECAQNAIKTKTGVDIPPPTP